MLKTLLVPLCAVAETLVLAAACPAQNYAVTKTLKVGGEGGWDYVTVDPQNRLLYLPRPTHTMIVEAADGKTVADIPGTKRAHGVALVPQLGRGFISDGEDGSAVIFDLANHQVLGKVAAADDADGIIFDPASNRILISCGDAGVLVPIRPDVDPKTGKADEAVKLDGKPEFLASDGQGKVYVNIADKDTLAVVDTRDMKVVNRWPTAPGGQPTGLAIDPAGGHLFIGCRNQHLIVMSTKDGHVEADIPIGKGVDACAFDPGRGDIFASCGDGSLYIVKQTTPGEFKTIQKLQTRPGARTMGIDPTTHAAYLPTAEPQQTSGGGRPTYKPGTFMVLVVTPVKQ